MLHTSNPLNESAFTNEKTKPSLPHEQIYLQTSQELRFIRSTLGQLKIASACYILSLACGMSTGHTSVMLRELQSNHSSIPTDEITALWIARAQIIAVPFGCLLAGICMDRWGRRKVIVACSGWFVFGLWLTSGAQYHSMIYVGRIINGFCCGSIITLIMVIIVEFSDHTTRGPLMTGSHVFLILGSALSYALALVLSWQAVSGLTGILPILAIVAFYFQHESPVWLMRKFRMIEARRSLLWVHGFDKKHQAEVEHEEMMQRRRAEEIDNFRRLAGYSTNFTASTIKYWKILMSAHVLKPFMISLVFNVLNIFFGTLLFVKLAVHIFNYKEGNEKLDTDCLLLIAQVLRLPGLLASVVLLHWLRRRTLSMSSGIAASVFCLAIGILNYLSKSAPSQTERWIIIILIVLYITSDSWGFYVLPIISTAELIPGEARGILCGFIYAVNGILMCIFIVVHEELFNAIHNHQLFWVFTIFCLICVVYVYLFIPETKGKTLINLEDYFKTAHLLWVLQHVKDSRRNRIEINLNEMSMIHGV